jgi:hypothetical protein
MPHAAPNAPGPRKRLPIGLQTLSRLLEDGCYYADKSGYAVDLAQTGTYYFLSRPRRFGKSLFLDKPILGSIDSNSHFERRAEPPSQPSPSGGRGQTSSRTKACVRECLDSLPRWGRVGVGACATRRQRLRKACFC